MSGGALVAVVTHIPSAGPKKSPAVCCGDYSTVRRAVKTAPEGPRAAPPRNPPSRVLQKRRLAFLMLGALSGQSAQAEFVADRERSRSCATLVARRLARLGER